MNKPCSKCKEPKPLTEFFKTGKQKSGRQKYRGDCKVCASSETSSWREKNRSHYNSYMGEWRTKNPDKIRAIDMRRKYGLSLEDYNQMVHEQKNLCKICVMPAKGKRPLAIDHCHATGKIRGLLCYRCNLALVILDNKDLLEKAIKYLSA